MASFQEGKEIGQKKEGGVEKGEKGDKERKKSQSSGSQILKVNSFIFPSAVSSPWDLIACVKNVVTYVKISL